MMKLSRVAEFRGRQGLDGEVTLHDHLTSTFLRYQYLGLHDSYNEKDFSLVFFHSPHREDRQTMTLSYSPTMSMTTTTMSLNSHPSHIAYRVAVIVFSRVKERAHWRNLLITRSLVGVSCRKCSLRAKSGDGTDIFKRWRRAEDEKVLDSAEYQLSRQRFL